MSAGGNGGGGGGTTFAFNSTTPIAEKMPAHGYHSSSSSSGRKPNAAAFYFFPQEHAEERTALLRSDSHGSYTSLGTEEFAPASAQAQAQAQGQAAASHSRQKHGVVEQTTAAGLHKSSSCNGIVRPKMTILKQDSVNGHVATSLSDELEGHATPTGMGVGVGTGALLVAAPNETHDEQDAFLVYTSGASSSTTSLSLSLSQSLSSAAAAGSTSTANNIIHNSMSNSMSMSMSSSASTPRRSPRRNKARIAICYRMHGFITRNWYLSYLVPLSILAALGVVAYLTRDYAAHMLYWIETQNKWLVFGLFMLFFSIVSFPIVVGYFVLMITAGYLFGCLRGFLTVILGANLGVIVAHATIRSLRHRIPMHKLIKNETGRAILRVIAGPRAFRVVLFTRLTPIPFGLQNAIFGVSSINPRVYFLATFLGLLPAQTINVYLGSTLRSMQEVLNNNGTAVTGYISFVIEVVCGIGLMFWVVQKARKELSETLLSDISNDGKVIDIQV